MDGIDDRNAQCDFEGGRGTMFGPSLLVANVVEKGARSRTVYLPAGTKWYHMNDFMREYEGGQTIAIPVTLDSIPMFLRGGSILFTSEDVTHILSDTMRRLDLTIGADGDSSMVFYDDDGHTQDFRNGAYAKTTISVKSGDRKVISFHKEGS